MPKAIIDLMIELQFRDECDHGFDPDSGVQSPDIDVPDETRLHQLISAAVEDFRKFDEIS